MFRVTTHRQEVVEPEDIELGFPETNPVEFRGLLPSTHLRLPLHRGNIYGLEGRGYL